MLSLKIVIIGALISYGIALLMKLTISCITLFSNNEGGKRK